VKIKSLELENFRQFKDLEQINFSTDEHSNITLILGDNTSGKTTILQSFLWCFYGKTNFDSKEHLFNEENAMEMQNGDARAITVSVTIEHDGYEYIIKREQMCKKINEQVELVGRPKLEIYYKTESGETKDIEPVDARYTMNDILPEDLSNYFFYDTERFGNITSQKDVTTAVKGLLGLTVLENAIEHLGRRTRSRTVIGKFFNELNQEGDQRIIEIHQEMDKNEQRLDEYKTQIASCEQEIEKYMSRLEEKENELRELKPSMEIQKEIDKERELIKVTERIYNRSKDEFQNSFHKGALSFFMKPLTREVEKLLVETEIKDEGIRDMNSRSIQDIIKRGYCICGTKIEKNSKEYQSLEKTLEFLPPQSLGIMINNYQKDLKVMSTNPNFVTFLIDKHKYLRQSKEEVQNAEHRIEVLSKDLEKINEVKSLQKEVTRIQSTIRRLRRDRDTAVSNRGICKDNLEKLQQELDRMLKISEKNEEIYHLLRYAEKVAEWFNDDYEKREQEIRNNIGERVNHYFNQIYHGDRHVKIDSRYRVFLYSKNDSHNITTDESAGLETVKNFSFIAGLVDMAKKKLDKNNEEEFDFKEEYPLVLDAPFSNVDEQHVINISKVLPEVAGQLILIVMEKDWNYAAEKLKSKVGKTYYLNKVSETYTEIQEG